MLRDSLLHIERSLWEAWKARDTTYYRRELLPGTTYVSSGGVSPLDSIIAQVERFKCRVDTTTLEHPDARRISAGAAVLVVHASVAYTCGTRTNHAAVWSSTVFVMVDRRWRIAFHQESAEPTRPGGP